MWLELCIQTQLGRFVVSVCNLRLIGYTFAENIKRHRHRVVGACLRNVGLRSLKNIEISCLVLRKQRRSRKLNHPDKTDIYNGQNSVLDKFVSDPQMSEYTCPDYEDFSVYKCLMQLCPVP